ncbi:MAG: ribosome-associated translation inhibitor RaiA [Rhodospirillaceae bacterium]|nr:ribosome-associated translation inhibitor RaiA [Rhodospirillaceae bacterium]
MNVKVTGRHLDVGQALRRHAESTIGDTVGKFFERALDSTVTFDKSGHEFAVDIKVHVSRGLHVLGEGRAEDPYAAFNKAAEHIAKRLRRNKRRIRDHHPAAPRDLETLTAQQYILAHDEEPETEQADASTSGNGQNEPVVVADMTTDIASLTVGEAVMRMDLADLPAMMFRNVAHGGLNMIYRRADGHIGWVDPEGAAETQ